MNFADFSAGTITSDAGLLLLREADRQIGLLDALDAVIPDPRSPDRITHPQRTLLAQRVFAIACGYEDRNDHHTLRTDPLWHTATDHPEPDPTLARPPPCADSKIGPTAGPWSASRPSSSTSSWPRSPNRRPNSPSTWTPPRTPSTAPRRADTSTPTTAGTAFEVPHEWWTVGKRCKL